MTRQFVSIKSLGRGELLFRDHVTCQQEHSAQYKRQSVSGKNGDRMPPTVNPHSSRNFSISPMTAKEIMAVSGMTVEGVPTKVNIHGHENGKVGKSQQERGNKRELGSPGHQPTTTPQWR